MFYSGAFRLFLTLLFILYSCCSFSRQPVDVAGLELQWRLFLKQVADLPHKTVVPLEQLNHFPLKMLLSGKQYPAFDKYPWSEIKLLRELQQNCKLADQVGSVNTLQKDHLKRAVEFELAICRGEGLSDEWFHSGDSLHPAGGSYADRYLATLEGRRKADFFRRHNRELTLANTLHPLHSSLVSLSADGSDALLSGYRSFLAPDDTLWLADESGIAAIEPQRWRGLLQGLSISVERKVADQICIFNYSNLCVQAMPPENGYLKWLVVSMMLVMLVAFIIFTVQRKKAAKERKFILQFLTNELRTPITSLGFTIEGFRKNVDQLDDNARNNFGRLLADYQRLFMLAETSKDFLSLEPHAQFQVQTSYLSDWLDHILEKYQLNYVLDKDQELKLPYYWLGICLDYLLRNAQQQGETPISINVSTKDFLRIEVKDQGNIPHYFQRFLKCFQYKRNMEVGQRMVTHLVKKMGGRLICHQRSSHCILELPL